MTNDHSKTNDENTTVPVDVSHAVKEVKGNSKAKFDETVEVHVHLGVDAEKSDQMVRGSVTLPAGTPKQKKVVVVDDATGEKLIAQIEQDGKLDADVVVATPSMMPKLAKVAKILGPQGLMPNPKTGTVSDKPADVVKELEGGKISFKMDKGGTIHEAIGKVSWEADQLEQNLTALIEAVKAAKPASAKGTYLKSISVCTTMGPAVRVVS